MIGKLKELNEALPGVLIVDLVYMIIGEVIIMVLIPNPWIYAVGFFAGILYAVFCVIHMSFRIRRVVYGKAEPRKSMIAGYFVRLAVMVALFAVLYVFNIGDLLSALIGMFAMKVSAYVQPMLDGITSKI